ncbi:hypothetical protein Tco_0646453 [Tanacetum coccineum]
MEQYLAFTRRTQAPSVVKPAIGNNVNFKINSKFMRELREDTFSRNKNVDANEHVERVLDIVSLFNIPGVTHDAIMLRDLLDKAFIQRYCPSSKIAKQLEEIHNFKQEEDKTLYQAWEMYNDLLYKCPTYDMNSQHKVNIFYNRRTSSISSDGIAAITSKLDSLGRHMKKLKENMHALRNLWRNQNAALKNLETQVEQLTKDFQAKVAKEAPISSTPIGHCKENFANNDAQSVETSSNETNKLHKVSSISDHATQVSKKENEEPS